MNDQALNNQLSRIEGQVRGIRRMVEEDRDCLDVLQQILAVRASLSAIGTRLLQQEFRGCVNPERAPSFDKVVTQVFKLN